MRFLDLALDDVAAEIEVGLEVLRRLEALRGAGGLSYLVESFPGSPLRRAAPTADADDQHLELPQRSEVLVTRKPAATDGADTVLRSWRRGRRVGSTTCRRRVCFQ